MVFGIVRSTCTYKWTISLYISITVPIQSITVPIQSSILSVFTISVVSVKVSFKASFGLSWCNLFVIFLYVSYVQGLDLLHSRSL